MKLLRLFLLIIILLGFSCCKTEQEDQSIDVINKQSVLDGILYSLEKKECIEASDAKLLFSDSELDKFFVLFYSTPYYDSSALRKKSYLESPKGKKLLAKYDSVRTRLQNQNQYLEFPIEFTGDYDFEQKSFFYTIDNQAYTTIDLEYQVSKRDTFYYLTEEQAQSIIEEGLEFQKSQARIFKDRYLPQKFIEDILYSHKHPRIEKNDDEKTIVTDFSKIIVSRLYKIPVKEAIAKDMEGGQVKIAMSFKYTGNIVNNYTEIKNLAIKVFYHRNKIAFSKHY
jgi:hypothetical protein